MEVAGRRRRRRARGLVMAAGIGAALCAPVPARSEDTIATVLAGWRSWLPGQLRTADPYALPIAQGALPFAAPVDASNLFALDVLGAERAWRAGVACDEERRRLGDPGALIRIEIAVRF